MDFNNDVEAELSASAGWETIEKEILDRSKIFIVPKGATVKLCGAPVILQHDIEVFADPVGIKFVVDLHERLEAEGSPYDHIGEDISFDDFRKLNPCIDTTK